MHALRWFVCVLALVVAAGALVPASAGVHLGTISVGAGYSYYGGPYWAGYYPPPVLWSVV